MFGNGDPLDAAALVARLDRHLGEESTSCVKFGTAGAIQSWEAIDDMSVKITLNFGWAQFPGLLSTDLGMVQNTALVERAR